MTELPMSNSHHHNDGAAHGAAHHGHGSMNIQAGENKDLYETNNNMVNLMTDDPIHHHLAESSGAGHQMMHMFFHGGCDEVILFDWWRINTYGGLVASMLACVALGILYEALKAYREYVIWRCGQKEGYHLRRRRRYDQASTTIVTTVGQSSSEELASSAHSTGITRVLPEGDAEAVDITEDNGSSSSRVDSEQVRITLTSPDQVFIFITLFFK